MSLGRFYEQKSLSRSNSGCFDCNICLDYVCDPVVTLCGHLYCWPCIYKWFHAQSSTLSSNEHPTCPVCKNEISHTTLVPLYGRGHTQDLRTKPTSLGMAIPPRPQAFGTQILENSGQQLPYRNPYQNRSQNHEDDYSSPISGTTTTVFLHPVVLMIGELFCARISGNGNPNSYSLMGSGNSPHLRRQEMQADKSLSRLTIFLFCCFLICFLLI